MKARKLREILANVDDDVEIFVRNSTDPAGQLYVNLDDYMNIKGSVLDDYKVVPSKVD